MYSVLRFYELSPTDLTSLGQELNHRLPGVFKGADRGSSNRVSISIAEGDVWEHHALTIRKAVECVGEVIANATENGHDVELDIAIEPEDHKSLVSEVRFDFGLLSLLVSLKAGLVITIYGSE